MVDMTSKFRETGLAGAVFVVQFISNSPIASG